jgi:hypothetical protein
MKENKYVSIAKGVLNGAIDASGFDDIQHCIVDIESLVKDAEAAFVDFKKRNVSGAESGVKDVGAMIYSIYKATGDCNLGADLKKLESMAEIFSSPMSFAYHVGKDIVLNGVDIYHEVEAAITAYETQ